MKSSRNLWLLLAFLGRIASAQNITNAEYYFDHDPGVGHGTAITISAASKTVIGTNKIITTGLLPGLHYIYVRSKNANGVWSIALGKEFLIPNPSSFTQSNIVKAEYYFDHDPGIGNGTALPSFTGAHTVNITDKITTNSLSPGLHHLYVRAKNANGVWSIVMGQEFLMPNSGTFTQPDIVKAEYFFDHDPGIGNATAFLSFTGANTVNVTDRIITTGLTPGLHHLYVRGKNANGVWSIVMGQEFLIPNPTSLTQPNIVKAEYYFDHDPGLGNAIALPSFTASNTVNVTDKITTAGLSPGLHHLYVRAQNDAGSQWSIVLGKVFQILDTTKLKQSKIVQAEYFVDTDPGVGSGTQVTPTFISNTTVDTVRKLVISNSLSLGRHYLFMRAKNALEQWSIVLKDSFDVETPVVINATVIANELCSGGSTGDASVTSSGGTSPYTYSWSNGTTTNPTGLVLSGGTFTVTVTDNLGETSTASVTITQPPAVGVIITSVSNVSCNVEGSASAGSVTGGTSPYTYSWSPTGGSNSTATGLSVGTYTVTVTDRHGCTGTAAATISQPPSTIGITISSVASATCNGGNGTITAHVATGGTSPYTYSWSPAGGTSITTTALSAGTYTITVTDNHGCSSTASATITQPATLLFQNTTTFPYTGAIQNYTVPANITQLTITAAGGEGGSDGLVAGGGGDGAIVTGKCNVTPGDNLSVFAGGEGANYDGYNFFPGGGGGASSVYDATSLNLLIVGGGGGGSTSTSNGGPGGTDIATNTTTNGNSSYNAAGGTGGSGGTVHLPDDGEDGAAGAGWNSNGANGASGFVGGSDFANGLTGGSSTDGNDGGFGGGGAGSDNNGGGGGGYNGGGGGYDFSSEDLTFNGGGGGGGSYLNGTVVGTPLASDTGNGYVIISYPTVITVNQNVECHGGVNGSLTAPIVEGGSSPYTYLWSSGGGTRSTATGLTAGTYTLTVTDSHGCTNTISTTITQPASALGVTLSSVSNINCHGGTGSAATSVTGGTSPYTYSWSSGGGTMASNSALSAGTYTINITDNHGCTATVSATITQPASAIGIAITSITNVSCSGAGSITAGAATGGTSPYTYSWSSAGGSNLSITGISAGTYTITVKDNHGCTATASATITQPASLPGISISTVSNISCNGGTGNAVANAATGGSSPYTYSWSGGGGTNLNVTGLSAGTYTLTVTDNHGCTAIATATLTQPASALGITLSSVTSVSCNGGTGTATATAATGGTSPYTYSWSASGGTSLTTTAVSAGTYTMTVKDNHGCSATVSATLTQPALVLGISITSVTNVSCNVEGSIAADGATGGTSPYTYSWSSGAGSNLTITGLSAGTYTITATDNHGCTSIASATVTQPASSLGIAISLVSNVSCHGGTGNATASGATGGTSPYTYSWSGGGGTNLTSTALSAGTYTITVTDNHGCTAIATTILTQPAFILGITLSSVSNVSCNAGTGTATANAATGGTSPYTYSWSASGGTGLTTTDVSAGTYTITVKDNHGCSATASATITQPASALGISMSSVSNVSCHGGTGTATTHAATGGTSPYTYSWSPSGGTNITTTAVSAGTYTITVKDNHGCSATASATITQPASSLGITISTISNVSCNILGSATANAATGGMSPYTYSWSGGRGTNLSATGLSAGTYTITATDSHGCDATTSATISEPASSLGISISSVTNVNCNGGTGNATANAATGGTSPYTYSWSGGGGTSLISSALGAGTYTMTVTDNHGCVATASATVTQPASALGLAIASSANVACYGGTGIITANAASGGTSPYTYSWSGGGGTSLVSSALTAGTYTMTATDNHGCGATASAVITQPAFSLGIIISSVTNVNCNGGTGSITADAATGGTSPYTYSWSLSGGTNLAASGLSAGSYTITVTDIHGCVSTASATITQPTALAITISSETNIACFGERGTATANSATGGTSPYTYRWSNASTSLTATNLSAGTYTITATDNHGCTATASVTITTPASALGVSISSHVNVGCNGGTTGSATANAATGGTLPYSYSWSDGAGSSLIASGLSAGTYTITTTDNHGCTSTADVVITQPTALGIVISSETGVSCFGEANGKATAHAATGGVGPYTYSWSASGGTNLAATGLIAGTYTITATDNHGCTSTVSVTITQPASVGISITPQTQINCHGEKDSAIANAATGGTSPYTYRWTPSGGTNLTATNLGPGTYTITATDNHGCTATASTTITQPDALVIRTDSVNETTTPCNGSATVMVLSGGTSPYTYSWSAGQTTSTITGQCHGTYCCVVTDNNGCTQSVCVIIRNATGIEDIYNSSSIEIYPNPNTGQFTVEGVDKGMIIEVFDYLGQKISAVSATDKTMHINISTEANGVYLVRIIDKNGVLVTDKKMVKIQ